MPGLPAPFVARPAVTRAGADLAEVGPLARERRFRADRPPASARFQARSPSQSSL